MGGNQCSSLKWARNIMITFLISGLWHGANITFVIWGGIHGIFLVAEQFISPLVRLKSKIKNLAGFVITFLLVNITWVFFRAETLSGAVSYIASMFGFAKGTGTEYHMGLYLDNETMLLLIAGTIFSAPVFYYVKDSLKIINEKHGNVFESFGTIL